MKSDELYKHLKFTTDFSVDDWNELISLKFRPYFRNDKIFNSNKEVLRTEIINYVKFSENPDLLNLFDWTFLIFKECFERDEQLAIKHLSDSFYEISGTDLKWMTNAIIQPNPTDFSERDKMSYYFKVIDEILEGVFKPRFRMFDNFINYYTKGTYYDNSKIDFGQIIQKFPVNESVSAALFLKDPYFSITTNQWRNISAHKTFSIVKDSIKIEYGKKNIKTLNISFEQLKLILDWTQDIYRVIRLSEVLINLNYTKEVVENLGGTDKMKLRFESVLMHLINNIQIVGFQFVSTIEQENTFILRLKKKTNADLKDSVIHSSQFLERIASAIYDDEFTRDKFTDVQVQVIDDKNEKFASAAVKISSAMSKLEKKINLDEYLQCIDYEINNFA
ncbi:hypothetical protein [Marinilabilia rubra]|uniref:Uncharacterized protein n=1 Tax=Marinilabilia rubra TaxID=2162893 RepID=A0A2U2B380_9BACT|nr:hypothetical protein [Marinilabilia rubra]PWD97521.1 hypothetical protein DDZ16_20390 [Marinilabilia rubra]